MAATYAEAGDRQFWGGCRGLFRLYGASWIPPLARRGMATPVERDDLPPYLPEFDSAPSMAAADAYLGAKRSAGARVRLALLLFAVGRRRVCTALSPPVCRDADINREKKKACPRPGTKCWAKVSPALLPPAPAADAAAGVRTT